MYRLLSLPLFTPITLARVLSERASGPTVTIKNGTVIGQSSGGVDSFIGIPYAQPPIGDLRLRPPQTIANSFGTLTLSDQARACPQFNLEIDAGNLPSEILGRLANTGLVQNITNQGEDCLTINVQRPAGIDSSARLPVLFWIYGGGWEIGSTQQQNGTALIQKSIDLGEPIIYVAVNYRLGGFGFLAGSELAAEHSTNLGLRDQRLGMQWTAENIAAFGGDPARVTIWGESTGSFSVFDHTIVNNGDNTYNGRPLFRAAIMNSGCVWPTLPVTHPKAQTVYDQVVSSAGCGSANDTVSCLRGLSYKAFHDAANSQPGVLSYASNNLAYRPRPDPGDGFFPLSPDVALSTGQYARIPIIVGDQEDEGTLFALPEANLTSGDALLSYLTAWYPDLADAETQVQTLLDLYPDQILAGQPAGSPFDTGPLNNWYPEYKRVAAVLGDLTFTLFRRVYLTRLNDSLPAWSYLGSYLHGTPILGTFHASDVPYAYGYAQGGAENAITNQLQTYYISFVNFLDPNRLNEKSAGVAQWDAWTMESPEMLNLKKNESLMIPDSFRKEAGEFYERTLSEWRI